LIISRFPYNAGQHSLHPGPVRRNFTDSARRLARYGQKYRWAVEAHNSTGVSSVSVALYFQTPQPPSAPSTPTVPSNQQASIPTSPAMSPPPWTPVNLPAFHREGADKLRIGDALKNSLTYGYFIVAATFMSMLIMWGMSNTFGVFFESWLSEFGWTRALTAGDFHSFNLLTGVAGVIVARLTDVLSPRKTATACALLLGAGYLLMSQVNTAWQIYLFLEC